MVQMSISWTKLFVSLEPVMTINIISSLYIDADGFLEARAEPPYALLAQFLISDIQGNITWASELIGIINDIKGGTRTHWETGGNAYLLTLKPGNARLETIYGEPPEACELSLDDLDRALWEWIAFVEKSGNQYN